MATHTKGFFKKLLSSVLSAATVFTGTAALSTAIVSQSAISAKAAEASTFSWDNATVYFLLTDRFYNGNTSNDHSYGRGCDQNGNVVSGYKTEAAFQGGDFAGITKKINDGYFDDLGVNAIWLSAPYEQIHGYVVGGNGTPSYPHYSYHGYYVLDYTETDANFGTKQEFKTMVDTAHEHGIRIVMDIVMNHAGYNDLQTMDEYGFLPLKSGVGDWKSYYYSLQNTNNTDYHKFVDYDGSPEVWKKWWGPEWIRAGLPGGYEKGSGEVSGSLEGLPDFKTESGSSVGIPEVLKTKWTKEGTYDAKVSKYGSSGTVRSYLVKWLTEWVKEYGVDGFRCDTAKHVEMESWVALKNAGVAALKEWRQNNPSAPGAKWTDDFWMTGECFGHGADKSNYFTSGAFDSMINFSFTGVDSCNVPGAGSVEGVYSSYASKFNNDPSFNMLTYLASHDTTLITGDRKYAGSFLLMCPGGIQIYYGDEICRPMAQVSSDSTSGAGHKFRSFMNWDSMDAGVLDHWQKLGQFRNNHLSVGAGAHQQISAYSSSTGYTFSRTYNKNGVSDKVVVTLFASPNQQITVDVSGVFSDGTEVTNFYDGTTAKVSGGKVTFNSGANGTILIQEPDGEKGVVNVKHIDQASGDVLKTETLSGLVGDSYTAQPLTKEGFTVSKTEGNKTGTFKETPQSVTFYYSFDSENYAYITVKHLDAATSAEIADSTTEAGKVGSSFTAVPADVKDYEVDLSKSDNPTITVKKGTNTITFKYNYVEPSTAKVHYYNANGWSSVNMYAYTGDGETAVKLLGVWPGKAMTAEGNGWFVCDVPDTETCRVLFNAGASGPQEPAQDLPGYEVTGEVWIKDAKIQTASKVTVMYVSTDGKTLGTATLKGISGDAYQTEAKTFTGYTLSETPSNATGVFGTSTITVTYKYKPDAVPVDELKNTSTISATKINKGQSVTITGKSTGGTGTKQYAVWYKKSTNSTWTTARDYATGTSITITPKYSGTYDISVKVKDGAGTIVKKAFTVTVVAPTATLTNTSTASKSTVAVGGSVKVTCSSTGGTGTKKYQVWYKRSSVTEWTMAQDYDTNTSVTIYPKHAASYSIHVKVKDGAGTVVTKAISLKVTSALTNTSKLSASSISKGSSVTVTCSATGGSGTKKYQVWYKRASATEWSKAQDYSTTTSVKITPKYAETYTISVKVKDGAGTVVKKHMTLKVASSLTNTSKLSATSISKGSSVTVTCSATGGSGTKKYQVWYKRASVSEWTKAQDYSTTTSVKITPKHVETYTVSVKVKDGAGTVVKKHMTLKVTAALTNTSKLSASSITKGSSVTVTCSATGGSGTKKYEVWYKRASASEWTKAQAYSTTTSVKITPKHVETYTVSVKVKDGAGTVVKKRMTLTVKSGVLLNTSTVSSQAIIKGKTFTVNCSSTGGTGTKKYEIWYKKASSTSWTQKQSYSTNTSVSITPAASTVYDVCTKVKDGNGTVSKMYSTVCVNPANSSFKNTSTISATSVSAGTKITLKGASSYAEDMAMYKYEYKSEGASSYTTIKDYTTSTSATFTPSKAGRYFVRVLATDMAPTTKVKTFVVTVS